MVFVVICEHASDFRTATELAVRVVREQVDWLEAELVPHLFQWVGRDAQSPFWLWREIDDVAREAGIRTKGHFDGEPGREDAQTTRRALNYLRKRFDDEGIALDGILLIRDDDRHAERRQGLEQGRASVRDFQGRTVIGLAHLKRECWVLHGFLPANDREASLLAEVCRELTFDPTRQPFRLGDRGDHEPRSAKRVLDVLTQGVYERAAVCWAQAPLAILRERGGESGLAAYLVEVKERLGPRFAGGPGARSAG